MRLLTTLCLTLLFGCMLPASRAELLRAEHDDAPSAEAPAAPLPELVLRRIAPDADSRAFVQRVHQLETRLSGKRLVAGNQVTLLLDGPATHRAQVEAIRGARHHVHLVTYIITDDKVGQRYKDALIERARAGVKVRMMFDSIGGVEAGAPFREALREAGVELHEYAPVNPLKDPVEVLRLRISQRDHRKILIVDGRMAFTGGIGISDEYRQSSSMPSAGGSESGWRDTHVRIEGPAVAEFQRLFFVSWEQEEEKIPPSDSYWPQLQPIGPDLVRTVTQHGNDLSEILLAPVSGLIREMRGKNEPREKAIYASYLIAMAHSVKRIWITQAYFAPNDEFIEALKGAARRGSDVRLLMPGNSDVGLLLHASHHYYQDLLEAGIRLYEYQGSVLHAKTAVIDSVWSTVGSSNLDYRSFIHNDEANAIVIGQSFAREMEAMFLNDLESAVEIKLDTWEDRPLWDKVREHLAILLKYWI